MHGVPREQPDAGSYSSWKPPIAADCQQRCIYCGIHDSRYGGLDNYHVEHFRPKSKFPGLEREIGNLYLACAICNRFKSNDWPRDPSPENSEPSYPDPSSNDYNTVFKIQPTDFQVTSDLVSGKYVVNRLCLNRVQLIIDRRYDSVNERIGDVRRHVPDLMDRLIERNDDGAKNYLRELMNFLDELLSLTMRASNSSPYKFGDQKRPSSK